MKGPRAPFDFDADVLQRSHDVPVLVDFWAPWCGPCRVLGPTLDKLAAEANGRWQLCKINTDTAPELAQRYGIRGIPAVKLFAKGKVVKEFTGVLGESQVRAWLDEALPTEEADLLKSAVKCIEEGNHQAAVPLLDAALEKHPFDLRARVRRAQVAALGDLAGAATYIQDIDAPADLKPLVESLQFLVATQDANDLPDTPGRDPYENALSAIDSGDSDAAAQAIITVLQTDRYFCDDSARKLGVALFTVLGSGHPTTQAHRRTFDMWLF